MAQMTKTQIEGMIKDAIGVSLAELHSKVADNQQKHQEAMTKLFLAQGQAKTPKQQLQERGLRAGRFLRALAAAGGNASHAADYAKRWGDEGLSKALGESTLAGGGALVPEEVAADVIELLRARTVVRAMGAMQVPMPNGNISFPYQASGVSASYSGENQNAAVDEQTFGEIKMNAKKLTVITPISNDLLADASEAADIIVRDDMLKNAATREDIAFIRDDGTQGTPTGMRNQPNTTLQASAGTTVADVINDTSLAILTLEENNIAMTRPGWLMSPRSKRHLISQLDANSNRVWAAEMAQGTFMGFPFMTTTQIPNTLNGNESEIYFADFASLMIGETAGITVKTVDGAAYWDGNAMQSGLSLDQTVMSMIARHDFAARFRGDEIHVVTGVTWGV